jgi:hypothetical protein
MIIIEPSFGLANRIRVIASSIHLGEQLNETITILWDKTSEINCSFEELFQPIYNINIFPKKRSHRLIKSSIQPSTTKSVIANLTNKFLGIDFCARIIDGEPFKKGSKLDLLKLSTIHKNIYVKTCGDFGYGLNVFTHFKPTAALQAEIDTRVSKYTSSTFGLHIRRTDHLDAIGNSPLSLFVDKIKATLETDRNANFYLSTDDPATETHLKHLFGDKIITYKKDFSRDTPQGIKDALLDMFCLASTTTIYGSFNSSFSDVAARIGNIPLIILSA